MPEAESSVVDRPDRILQNYVAGEWRDIDSAGEVIVTDPATGAGLAVHPMSSVAEIDSAVATAAEAFRSWRMTPVPTRAALMFRYRHLLQEARDELAAIIVAENGKSFAEARGHARIRLRLDSGAACSGMAAHITLYTTWYSSVALGLLVRH